MDNNYDDLLAWRMAQLRRQGYTTAAKSGGGGMSWSSYWLTLKAAMKNVPSNAYAVAADTFIKALVTGGVWSKLDRLFVFAAETNAGGEALLDWIHPFGTGAVLVGTPAFTAFTGFKADGTTSHYINTRFNAQTVNGNYQRNSASIGCWCHTINSLDVPGAETEIHDMDGSSYISARYGGSISNLKRISINSNYATIQSIPQLSANQMLSAVRESSTTVKMYVDKTGSSAITDNSIAVKNTNFAMCYRTNSEVSMGYFGAALSATEMATLYDAWSVFFYTVHP